MAARRRVELLKVPSFVSLAKDSIAQGNSVALFVCFNETVEAIVEALKCPAITGETPQERREKIMKAFRGDKLTCVVLNIAAGGVGISLHGKRQRLSLISPSWSAIELIQTIGRVRRAGGSYSIQKILFAAGTVEEKVCAKVRAKVGNIETLNDGDTQGIVVTRARPKPSAPVLPNDNQECRPKAHQQSEPEKLGQKSDEHFQRHSHDGEKNRNTFALSSA